MSNESNMSQSIQTEAQKVSKLQQSLQLIKARIGRDLEPEEVKAIGFVLDKDEVILGILGEGQNSQNSKWQIRQAIRKVTETEISRKIIDASGQGNNEEIEKLGVIRSTIVSLDTEIEQRYRRGEDFSLGAVPEYFLPDWVKNYRN